MVRNPDILSTDSATTDGPGERLSSPRVALASRVVLDAAGEIAPSGAKADGLFMAQSGSTDEIPRSRHMAELHCETRARPRIEPRAVCVDAAEVIRGARRYLNRVPAENLRNEAKSTKADRRPEQAGPPVRRRVSATRYFARPSSLSAS